MISPSVSYEEELAKGTGRQLLQMALDQLQTAGGEDRSDSDKIRFARECMQRALQRGVNKITYVKPVPPKVRHEFEGTRGQRISYNVEKDVVWLECNDPAIAFSRADFEMLLGKLPKNGR